MKFHIIKTIIITGLLIISFLSLDSSAQVPNGPNIPHQSRSLGDTPWPMFRYNLRHTGLSPYSTSDNPGKMVWKFMTGGMISSSPTIDSDGTIYVGSYHSSFYAVNSNGTLKWELPQVDGIGESSAAIGSDGTIYVGSVGITDYPNNCYLYAISPNGTIKWKFKTTSRIDSSPTIGKDGTIYIGSSSWYYAINQDGKLKWKFQTRGGASSSVAIGLDGTIYFGGGSEFYALKSNGKLKWKIKTNDIIRSSPSISPGGNIYIGSMDDHVYSVNPDGKIKWKFKTDGMVASSPAIGPEGNIYFGSDDNYLYAIYPNGTLKWKYRTDGIVRSSPAISADGTIYVGSFNKYLYAINPNGELRWRFKTEGKIRTSSPTIGIDGTVYIGSKDHYLYAIGNPPPNPPENLTAKSGDGSVALTWEPPEDNGGSEITNYNLYKGLRSGEETLYTTINKNTNSHHDNSVNNGMTYYYYITSVNSVGESNSSNEVNVIPIGPPSPPQNLKARADDGNINLNWEPPINDGGSSLKSYNIYKGNNSEEVSFFKTKPSTTLLYNDDLITLNTSYFYYVTATNEAGESDPSNMVSIIPHNNTNDSSPSIIIIDPSNNAIIPFNELLISGLASDDNGISKVEIRTDVINWITAQGTENWSGNVTLQPGINKIFARATDTSGNTNTYNIDITYDPIRPEINIDSPDNNEYISKLSIDLKGTAFDNVGLNKVEISTDGINWIAANGTNNWKGIITLEEGRNNVIARATDLAGNTNNTSVSVQIDTMIPQINIQNPINNKILIEKNIVIKGNSSDNIGVEKVEISKDGIDWIQVNGTTEWNGNLSVNTGRISIYARAIDFAGNIGITEINITIKDTETTSWEATCWPSVGLLLTLVILLIILYNITKDNRRIYQSKKKKRWKR